MKKLIDKKNTKIQADKPHIYKNLKEEVTESRVYLTKISTHDAWIRLNLSEVKLQQNTNKLLVTRFLKQSVFLKSEDPFSLTIVLFSVRTAMDTLKKNSPKTETKRVKSHEKIKTEIVKRKKKDHSESKSTKPPKKVKESLPIKLHYFEEFKAEDLDHLLVSSPAKVARQLKKEFESSRENQSIEKDKEAWQNAPGGGIPEKDRLQTRIKCHEEPLLNGAVGLASMKGKRTSMEDTHLASILEISVNEKKILVPLFAIFDGHGGKGCARFLEKNLARQFEVNLPKALREYRDKDTAVYNSLVFTINQLNDLFKMVNQDDSSGSTATVALLIDNTIYIANVGDSRAILCQGNEVPIALSTDAKLGIERFEESIDKRGGLILGGRVGGSVQVARALGDKEIDGMPSRPLITKYKLPNPIPKEFRLVIACDGLWNVASSSQIAKEVDAIKEDSQEKIAEHLIGKAYSAGSKDNISVLVVNLSKLPQTHPGKKNNPIKPSMSPLL